MTAKGFFRQLKVFFSGYIILFILGHFGHHVLNALIVPLLPFIRNDLDLNYAQSGAVVSAFILSSGMAQLPAGWLADRTDPRLMITLGVSGVAFAGLLIGLSGSYGFLLVFLILMGVLGGGYHPSAPPLLSATVPPKHHGRALGMHVIGGSASHFLAPLIGAGLAAALGWRETFIGLSIPMMLYGIVIYFFLRRVPLAEKAEPEEKLLEKGAIKLRRRKYVKLGAFILLTTSTASIFASVIAFLPLFFVDFHHISEAKAGMLIAVIYSAGFWAAPLGGFISDKVGRRRVVAACALGTLISILIFAFLPFGFFFIVVMLISGTLLFSRMPATEAYLINNTTPGTRSTILGIYFFAGMEGSGIFTPILGGIIDALGFQLGFSIMAGFLGVLIAASLLLMRLTEKW